jgi:hypothetical protein
VEAQLWKRVSARQNNFRDGTIEFEEIARYATPDLSYVFHIERSESKIGTNAEPSRITLRVTMIYRREDDGWKIVLRQADAVTTPRPIDSLIESRHARPGTITGKGQAPSFVLRQMALQQELSCHCRALAQCADRWTAQSLNFWSCKTHARKHLRFGVGFGRAA